MRTPVLLLLSVCLLACEGPEETPDPVVLSTPDMSAVPDASPAADMAASQDMKEPGKELAMPTIPPVPDDCPTFETGVQTILGLETHMIVGEPTDTPGPMLFNWHGTGGDGRRALNGTPSSIQEDILARGGILIAPTDNDELRTGPSPNGVWYEESDLEYADHLVACAVAQHNIDPRQIYATGCSAGGLMASAMTTKRSRYVAASFPNSGGSILAPRIEDGTPAPAVLTMHGGADDIVLIRFEDTSQRLAGGIVSQGGFAIDCNHMGRHCGAPRDLQEAGWAFVNAHPYGTSPSPYATELPASLPDYCRVWE